MNLLLRDIVGSQAYGLANEFSDTDRIGIFAEDTNRLFDLTPPKETVTTTDPDLTMHEAAKACRLLLKCNPTVTEILWLEEYEVCENVGRTLIMLREHFLSAQLVRNAYLGYATQQFKRFIERGSFNSDISDKRAPKHARHLYRLVLQGYELYTTGALTVRMKDPEACRSFGEWAVADAVGAKRWLHMWETKFDEAPTALHEKPRLYAIQDWLYDVRACYYPEAE